MEYKKNALLCLEKRRNWIYSLGESLFACPELGFKEYKTNRIICAALEELEIPFQNDVALTGIRATLGSGSYHIALVTDMDAVDVGGRPFHSCGHSIQSAVMLGVLAALKETGIVDELGGKVSFIAAPAEEYIDLDYRLGLIREGKIRYPSGKQNMIYCGLFDSVDCGISVHVSGDEKYRFDVGSTLTGFTIKKVTFHGRAAHSGAAPHLGKNALHGAVLSMDALAFLAARFAPEAGVRIHPVIKDSGMSMNVIPETVILESYVRANTREAMFEARERFDACVRHCAEALDLTASVETRSGYLPLCQSETLCGAVYRNMLEICSGESIAGHVASGASGDMGDLGFLIPCVQFGFSGIQGRIHSDSFTIADPEHVYMDTARVALKTVIDILADPQLRVRNGEYEKDKAFYINEWLSGEGS
ncbi:MAG: amidohydrolase [Treponema sp.]|jgi:amidohydrolase|nr:amidohydrolase [Treponema sp.]